MTAMTRKQLARQALEKSLEVREEYSYDFRSPLVRVRARRSRRCEGAVRQRREHGRRLRGPRQAHSPALVPPSTAPPGLHLRPRTRPPLSSGTDQRSTNSKMTSQIAGRFSQTNSSRIPFAGFILMPAQAVKRAFSTRGLAPTTATPEQIYQVASSFGVGYQTLTRAPGVLAPVHPGIVRQTSSASRSSRRIRERILGFRDEVPLGHRRPPPRARNARRRGRNLGPSCRPVPPRTPTTSRRSRTPRAAQRFRAMRPGLARVSLSNADWGVVVRVSRKDYAGLAKYRHLEEIEGD